jgi:hypothetical protein
MKRSCHECDHLEAYDDGDGYWDYYCRKKDTWAIEDCDADKCEFFEE